MSRVTLLVAASCLALVAAAPSLAAAAETNATPENVIEEITVTARRTEENLQRVPVAVTATTGEALEKAQIHTIDQLQNITPGLLVVPAVAQPGSAGFALRGQGSTDGLIAVDAAIGVYVDGVYVARSSGGLLNFYDIERVEVLRGPQGTLFGRNTTGGAINIITRKPTREFEGSVMARAGNYATREFVGVLNAPVLGGQVALRSVYQHTEHKGYGYDPILDRRIGGDNSDSIRGSVLIAPDEQRWSLLVQGDYTDRRTGGELIGLKDFRTTPQNQALIAACSGPSANALCPYKGPAGDGLGRYAVDVIGTSDFWTVYTTVPDQYGDVKVRGASATLEVDLGHDVSLKVISASRGLRTDSLTDFDGAPYTLGGGLRRGDGNFIHQDQMSHEVQLTGKILDRLNWIAGAFYFREDGTDRSRSYALYPVSPNVSVLDATVRNKSKAIFGQATYKITDTVRFTGGLRYTWDDRYQVRYSRNVNSLTGATVCAIAASALDPGQTCRATDKRDFGYLSYTASLDWQARENAFLYVKTSRADRSGGLNTRAVLGGLAVAFEPETVTDYEVGSKLDLYDRRVRLNLAAFYTDFENVQINVPFVVPGSNTLTAGIQNAATAKIQGIEGELTVAPTTGLRLGASFSYLDAKYTKFEIQTSPGVFVDVSQTPFSYAPKFTYTLSADYTTPTPLGDLGLHADWAHRTSQQSRPPFVGAGQFGSLKPNTSLAPGYGILNGEVSLNLNGGRVRAAVYGRNLLQEKYFARVHDSQSGALGTTAYIPGDPRTYGVSVTAKF